jgi:hypothetical protein
VNACAEAAVRAALALAATYKSNGCVLGAQVQSDIIAEVWVMTERSEANGHQRPVTTCLASSRPGRLVRRPSAHADDGGIGNSLTKCRRRTVIWILGSSHWSPGPSGHYGEVYIMAGCRGTRVAGSE